MALESTTSTMETSTRACGEKTKDTVKVSTITRMERFTEECIDRDSEKGTERLTIGTEIGMKESGRMGT